jgi:hypothetical protein
MSHSSASEHHLLARAHATRVDEAERELELELELEGG